MKCNKKLLWMVMAFILFSFINAINVEAGNVINSSWIGMEGNVLYMNCDEINGSGVYDYSGLENNGSVSGATIGNICIGGKSCNFTASVADWVQIPDGNQLDMNETITILVWVYPNGNTDNWDRIVEKKYSTSWEFGFGTTNLVNAEINDAENTPSTNVSAVSPSSWQFVSWTYDMFAGGTTESKIYINGTLNATADYSTKINQDNEPITIGRYAGSTSHSFNGYVDELLIFNRTLTEGEISMIYNCTNQSMFSVDNSNCNYTAPPPGADSNLTYINITSNTCTTSSPFALNATLRCQPGGGENCSGLWNISAMSSGCSLYNGTNKGSFNFNSTTGDFSFLTYYACSVSANHLFWLNASNSDNLLNLSNVTTTCSAGGGGLTADESNCLLHGTFVNGSNCAVGNAAEDNEMEIAILMLIGMLLAICVYLTYYFDGFMKLIPVLMSSIVIVIGINLTAKLAESAGTSASVISTLWTTYTVSLYGLALLFFFSLIVLIMNLKIWRQKNTLNRPPRVDSPIHAIREKRLKRQGRN